MTEKVNVITGEIATGEKHFEKLSFQPKNSFGIGSAWYLSDQFKKAELVTDRNWNDHLHIDQILLYPSNNPTRPQTVGSVSVVMFGGLITFGGWINQDGRGGLIFNEYTTPYTANGETKYNKPCIAGELIHAQILRYAHACLVAMPEVTSKTPAAKSIEDLTAEEIKALLAKKEAVTPTQATAVESTPISTNTVDISSDDLPF